MRTLTIVLAAAALSLAGCKKKHNDAPAPTPGSGSAGSGSAGSGSMGSGSAGSGSAGSGSAEPAGDQAMTNKAGNCPAAVAGAVGAVIDDKDHADAVVLSITAPTAPEVATIRKRAAHLVEVQDAPDATIKHSGEGTGGGEGKCPVITARNVKIASAEIEGGVKITMTPAGDLTLDALKKDVADRLAKVGELKDFTPTDHSGGGGGQGGGSGDHGGNHSGDGDGHGKEKKQDAAPPGEPPVKTGSGAGSQS